MEDKHILVALDQVRPASLGEIVAKSSAPLLLPGPRVKLENTQVYEVFIGWTHPLQIPCRPTEQEGLAD